MIQIEDPNFLAFLQTKKFKAALCDESGKANPKGNYLNPEAAAKMARPKISVRNLDVSASIKNVHGIEYFTQCTSLALKGLGLEEVHALPPKLESLHLSINYLRELPTLPTSLISLDITYNERIKLNVIPEGIEELTCDNCNLSTLPKLPTTLKKLSCQYNNLTELADLPEGIREVNGSDNKISKVGKLPASLEHINLESNRLTAAPSVSEGTDIDLSRNPIKRGKKNQLSFGVFEDNFNLKLVIIEKLIETDSALRNEIINFSNMKIFGYNMVLHSFLLCLKISKEQLSSITELCFDGGHDIYRYLNPGFDGEDDYFDITSFDGIAELQNLETIEYISMVADEASWAPLLELSSLKELKGADLCDDNVIDELEEKGVIVE